MTGPKRHHPYAKPSDIEAALAQRKLDDFDDGYPPPCTNPSGHEWPNVEEHERCLCLWCGADGDA